MVDQAGQGTAKQGPDGVLKAATALEDAGYAVEEVELPSIDLAAKTLLAMVNTLDVLSVPSTVSGTATHCQKEAPG